MISENNPFPISKTKHVDGSRHLAREKVLQVLSATADGEVSLDDAYPHIFFRQFTWHEEESQGPEGKILKPAEVIELDADIPIVWVQSDIDYAVQTLESARDNKPLIQNKLEKYSKNWDVERIAQMDRNLLALSIAELIGCKEIPVKVTINEVIELSKKYSTDKSGKFINGLLDAVVTDLTAEGLIKKVGRGLV